MSEMNHNSKQVEELLKLHSALLHDVVDAIHDKSKQAPLLDMLNEAQNNGWQKLCEAIRSILEGQRDDSVLDNLDEEDAILIQAILIGIDNPETLPENDLQKQRDEAALGLATTIAAACQGDQRAMELVAHMDQTFQDNPQEIGTIGNAVRKMINGERSSVSLLEGLDPTNAELVEQVLEQLKIVENKPQKFQPWLN